MFSEGQREFRSGNMIYRCLSELGSGQTATVYHAVREDSEGHTRQVVALKVLKDLNSVQSLRHEFEILSKMNSNLCAKVLAWEQFTEGPALVLEWIAGASLAELQRERILKSEWADEIAAQIEIGLQDLEANGLHHGDLSPANIMVDNRGRIRLIDFASDNQIARGTLDYIAPEIWCGVKPSIEADLFALGLIHYDLQTTFCDTTLSEVDARARALRLSRAEPGHPLSIDPESRDYLNRPQNAAITEEMANDVSKYLDRKINPCVQTRALSIVEPLAQPRVQPLVQTSSQLSVKSPPTKGRTKWSWALRIAMPSVVVILAIPIFTVQAQAPRETGNPTRGTLTVATHSWVHLWLNGRDIGYSPLAVQHLLPGTHRLRWQTSRKSGEMQIKLLPGSQLRLAERDFSKLE